MEALNIAAASPCYLPTKKLSDLSLDTLYNVSKIKKVQTKFGLKVVLELNNQFDIFLPKKVCDLLIQKDNLYHEFVEKMNAGNLKLKSLGSCLIEFIY